MPVLRQESLVCAILLHTAMLIFVQHWIVQGNMFSAVMENRHMFSPYQCLPWHQLYKQYFYKLQIINRIDFGLLQFLKWFVN